MATSDTRLVVKNRGFFGGLKQANEKSIEQISGLIMAGEELQITLLNDVTNSICFYDHGPAISLFEMETFVRTLCKSVKELAKDEQEIFSHMLCAISEKKADGYTIRDTSVMIFKPPFCVIVKFGSSESCKYLMHLQNHVLYYMGALDKPHRPVPYQSGSYESYRKIFEQLKGDMVKAEEDRIMKNFAGFKESLREEQYEHTKDVKESNENTFNYTKALEKLTDKIDEQQDQLMQAEKDLEVKRAQVQTKMVGFTNTKTKKSANLPELQTDN